MNGVPVNPKARSIKGLLRITFVVDDGRDQLNVRLRLNESTHYTKGPAETRCSVEHSRNDGVVGTTTGNYFTTHFKTCRTVVQDDPGPWRHDARTKALEEALNE